jgi:outer membrane protein assembly factor BamB
LKTGSEIARLAERVRRRWPLLLTFLPLLGSVYIYASLRAEQARLLDATVPIPLPEHGPAPWAVAWARDLGESGLYAGTANGLVLAYREDRVVGLDGDTGEIIWSRPMDGVYQLALMDGVLVANTMERDLYGLDPRNGATLWTQPQAQASIARNTVTAERTAEGRWLTLFDPVSGTRQWEAKVTEEDWVEAMVQVEGQDNRALVLATDGEQLLALDGQSGEAVWTTYRGFFKDGIVSINRAHLVYQHRDGGQFCVLRLADGAVAWCKSRIIQEEKREWPINPAVEGEVAVVKTDRYTVAAIAIDSGETVWTFSDPGPREPITFQSKRPTELDTARGRAYFTFGPDYALYAVDTRNGQPVWRSGLPGLFDVEILGIHDEGLFLIQPFYRETKLIIVAPDTGQIVGRLASGALLAPLSKHPGLPFDATSADSDDAGFVLYGMVHESTAPGRPNLLIGPQRRILVKFSAEVDHEAVAARSRNWWAADDRLSAWYTIEIALRNDDSVATNSPLAQTCRSLLEARLADLQARFAYGDGESVLVNFEGHDIKFMFHSLARSCPNSEDMLAQGYLLAGEAFANQAEGSTWYKYPLDNPYYRQLYRDLRGTPWAAEALAKLNSSRQGFFARLWFHRLWLLLPAFGLPFFFYKLREEKWGRVAAVMSFFNLIIAGPLFDMATLELRALRPIVAPLGLQVWGTVGTCIMGCGCVLCLLALPLMTSSARPRNRPGIGYTVIAWVIDSAVMLLALGVIFPYQI